MRRPHAGWLACTLAAAAALLAPVRPVQAASSPLAGNWKVVVVFPSYELTPWLVEVAVKDKKPKAGLLSIGDKNFKGSKLTAFQADAKAVRLTFQNPGGTYAVVAYLPPDEKKPNHLLGSLAFGQGYYFIRLDRTKEDELDPTKAAKKSPAGTSFEKIGDLEDAREKIIALKKHLKKYPKDPSAFAANFQLLILVAKKKNAEEEELRNFAAGALKAAAPYGREMTIYSQALAANLLGPDKWKGLALDHARKARKLLAASDPPTLKMFVLRPLATLLKKNGKADEAKEVGKEIAKVDEALDKEFLKNAIPFKPNPYKGRKKKSDRVVVVELFTGAQCPPCVAADIAFDALLQTYKPADVVFLQYHLHIPGPDALTNKDTVKRAKYYTVDSTPSMFLNGDKVQEVGGDKLFSIPAYKKLRKELEKLLEKKARGKLKLTVKRKGDKIEATAAVSGLKKTGDDVRVRFVLVEEVVRYAGRNGQRLHHHVVRAVRGGGNAFALEEKEASKAVAFDLAKLRPALTKYLANFTFFGRKPFGDEPQPLELKHLKVVAFIQDDQSQEILVAAQADVPPAKAKAETEE
jgi:hypothetical protein